jgi:glycerol-3-phosphate dehydrogenase subunit C
MPVVNEEIRASLDHCVKCTICESFCPVSAATPLFPGPKHAGPQSERFRLADAAFDGSVDYCSGCGICSQVCPHGVKIAELNAQARATLKAERGLPLRDRVLGRPVLAGRLATPVAPLVNAALGSRPLRRLAEAAIGIHRDAPLPRYAGRTFGAWARRRPPARAAKSVVYFHGCSTNFSEPRLGEMTVAVLERNGFRVIVPEQGCCGLPLQSNGSFGPARRRIQTLARRFSTYARRGYPIVATSTSCGLMLKREGREVLGLEDDAELQAAGAGTYDICEFLLGLADAGELDTGFRPLPLRVPYHAPCQGRGHGIGKPALDLLRLIPELEVIELTAECCGIAGTYGLKKEKHGIAMAVGAPLFEAIRDERPNLTACDSETCRWQIAKATGIGAVHPVELLYRAYGLA